MKYIIAIPLLFLFNVTSFAQKLEGLWEYNSKPAEWIRLKSDKTFERGQGWLKQAEGTWTYKKREKTLLLYGGHAPYADTLSINIEKSDKNELKVVYNDDYGDTVTDQLTRIEKLPRSIQDQLYGVWKMTLKEEDNIQVFQDTTFQQPYQLIFRDTRTFEIEALNISFWGHWGYSTKKNLLSMYTLGKDAIEAIKKGKADSVKKEWDIVVTQNTLILTREEDGKQIKETYLKSKNFDFSISFSF